MDMKSTFLAGIIKKFVDLPVQCETIRLDVNVTRTIIWIPSVIKCT